MAEGQYKFSPGELTREEHVEMSRTAQYGPSLTRILTAYFGNLNNATSYLIYNQIDPDNIHQVEALAKLYKELQKLPEYQTIEPIRIQFETKTIAKVAALKKRFGIA